MPPRRPPPASAATTRSQAQPVWRSPVPEGHNRWLPQADALAFTQCLGMYENKQFKEGLDTVQHILDKHPNHGESLVMKGIFLCSLDRKPEGYDCVRRGTKNDPGSHIVWHVYALVLRADKNFEEALNCYKKAVDIEKDSLNLLSDMAPLAVHLRKYDDYAQIRLQMLKTQPRVRRNWVNLAVAQFLARQYRAATQTLAYYEDMVRDVPEGDVEMGEVLLFHAQVLEEAGEYERCLDFLGDKSAQIVDRTAYTVQRARLLLKLGRTESALWAWETVLGENPESTEYIKATVQAKGGDCDATTDEARLAASDILSSLSAAHPRSLSIKRLQLSVLPASSPEFRTRAASYILNALSKGVPSAFADVKALYRGEEGRDKARIVGEVVEEFKKGLEDKGAVVTEETGDDDAVESPSTYLWTLYFLASHYSSLSQHSSALSTLSLALSHTPSLPELHTLRARILKRAGDPVGAAQAMEDARLLDGQDRFLNSKAAKYAIRNGEMERAEKTIGLFTRKDAPSPLEDMVEMQCLWFLQEEGDAYAAKEDWGRALRRYHQILDTFQDIEEDQYDFHSYCVRKYTLKAYIECVSCLLPAPVQKHSR
ncbi:NMDA receptor-regulated protein 1-domain-containing protein [Rhodotorula diobovata]|uniref:NMDA receptor-regulated protein 1-domain-containing protein n=1 Tax=Rhodotorula diobovata TaxID=5288 RepID=A0A5C5G5V4_9BASI|nr:NMDA receptor-regulated protein 1-domain-containing protein [Rhodotorula diobovata]